MTYSDEEALNILIDYFVEEKSPCPFGDSGDRSLVRENFCHNCPFLKTGCSRAGKTKELANELSANRQNVKEL